MELSNQTSRLVVTSGKTVSFIPVLPTGHDGAGTHTLTLPYSPSSASIHPILQDRFVTGNSGDEWVRVHAMDGEEREVLKGHHGPVHCVEFSPDGEMYASGSGSSNLYLWKISLLIMCYVEDGEQWTDFLVVIELNGHRHDPSLADHTGQSLWPMARITKWSLNWRWTWWYFLRYCCLCAFSTYNNVIIYHLPVTDLWCRSNHLHFICLPTIVNPHLTLIIILSSHSTPSHPPSSDSAILILFLVRSAAGTWHLLKW